MVNRTQAIRGNFDFAGPAVISSFVQGEDAEAVYDEVRETIKEGVCYDKNSRTMQGSSTFLAARVDSILRSLNKGIRVATLADLSRPEVMKMVEGNFYSDTPAIVLRSLEDSFKPNNALITYLIPQIEQKMGRLQLPVLITGFDVVSSEDKQGYGLGILLRADFSVLQDERLSGYDEEKFSTVDKNSLPNFERNGSRTWHARNEGLSRLCLGRDLCLDSGYGDDDLADSDGDGRIVLVRDGNKSKSS